MAQQPPDKLTFPTIAFPQVALLYAETRTGIVLFLDGKRFFGTGTVFVVFPNREEAEMHARKAVEENSEIECAIYDHSGSYLAAIRPKWVEEASRISAAISEKD